MNDFNAKVIEEFRANAGRVGPPLEGAPLVLLHHTGRKSGNAQISPTMCLPGESDPGVVYVFAPKGRAPTDPASRNTPSRPKASGPSRCSGSRAYS